MLQYELMKVDFHFVETQYFASVRFMINLACLK